MPVAYGKYGVTAYVVLQSIEMLSVFCATVLNDLALHSG